MKWTLIACALAGITLLAGCGSGMGSGPAINKVLITPTEFVETGKVLASADVTSEYPVVSVKVVAKSNTQTVEGNLTGPIPPSTYGGSLTLPTNASGSDQIYQVTIQARDLVGETSESSPVKVTVHSMDTPPSPPL